MKCGWFAVVSEAAGRPHAVQVASLLARLILVCAVTPLQSTVGKEAQSCSSQVIPPPLPAASVSLC